VSDAMRSRHLLSVLFSGSLATIVLVGGLNATEAQDEDKAYALVRKFAKVQAFSKRMSAKKQPIGMMADRKSKCVFDVRVYENHPDHIATFGFFDANICSGKVIEEQF
jgi:hypothetical protein